MNEGNEITGAIIIGVAIGFFLGLTKDVSISYVSELSNHTTSLCQSNNGIKHIGMDFFDEVTLECHNGAEFVFDYEDLPAIVKARSKRTAAFKEKLIGTLSK